MNPNSKGKEEMKRLPRRSLPEEVVVDILLRLPVKSLVRFKRVCKVWRALINDPSFATRHLRDSIDDGKSSSSAPLLIWLAYLEYQTRDRRVSLRHKEALVLANVDSQSDGSNHDELSCVHGELDLPKFLKEKMAFSNFFPGIELYHCNGIIGVSVPYDSEPTSKIAMFNPALKEIRFLPVIHHKFGVAGQGFGYDSRADDYKFVRVGAREANLYSLKTDSWTKININENCKILELSKKGVCCGGVCYWRNIKPVSQIDEVLAFDMSEEEFHLIPLPDGACEANILLKNLAVLKESVVLFTLIGDAPLQTLCDMWVLVDIFGGADSNTSWTKRLIIGPLQDINIPLGFWKDDELLFESRRDKILSYNLYTQKVRTVPLDLMVAPFKFVVESYTESLVSVK